MLDKPAEASRFFAQIAAVIERFTQTMFARTGSTFDQRQSHRPLPPPRGLPALGVLADDGLHRAIMNDFCCRWTPSGAVGIGRSASITAAKTRSVTPTFSPGCRTSIFSTSAGAATLPGCGNRCPRRFSNIRYSPVEIVHHTPDQIRQTVRRLVHESGNPWLTGVCCINMDEQVSDQQITALLEEVQSLRTEYEKSNRKRRTYSSRSA